MKTIVLKMYRDKYTNALHLKGSTVEITKERLSEINSTPLGIVVEEIKEIKEPVKKTVKK